MRPVAAAQSDHQVVLATVALQQGGKSRQEYPWQVQRVPCRERAQTVYERRWQRQRQAGALVALDRWTGTVGRQLKHFCRARKAFFPVGEEGGLRRLLPGDEIGEGRCRRTVWQAAVKAVGDLSEQQVEGFLITDVAVGAQQQQVLGIGETQQVSPEQRRLTEILGRAGVDGDPARACVCVGSAAGRFREAVDGQCRAGGGGRLRWCSEAAPERVVTGADPVNGVLQGVCAERPDDARAAGDAEAGVTRIGLLQEPDSFLGRRPARNRAPRMTYG
ncbi:MAG: hypothetical protein CAPSK01_003147 [Candidatus Accumulibacter vicinus]|uniref:Uncharacterized protein n=1 Tax=Candidatus Accumulibacter vicinus TaxID=2954382 RepID=A0A084XY45_9PROT|nr:MAG: hypothetical protein CAPSK01_003147 [Candidatus Accumulibacter vicinus]